jgi:hypothetical protein
MASKSSTVASASASAQTPTDPISFFCAVLRDETATSKERAYAAEQLLPYYHPELATIGPLLWRFLQNPAERQDGSRAQR